MQDDKKNIENYIFTADQDMRDIHGRYTVLKGDKYIRDDSGVLPDTPENRSRFIVNGWSHFKRLGESLSADLTLAYNHAHQFGTTLDTNINGNVGKVIPDINLPLWINLLPWPLVPFHFKEYREIRIDREAFVRSLVDRGVTPYKTLDDDAKRLIGSANSMRVYEISHMGIVFRIVVFFITPIDAECTKILPADAGCYQLVMKYFKEWEKNSGIGRCNCKAFVLASPLGWGDFSPVALHDNVQVLCSPLEFGKPQSGWKIKHPPLDGAPGPYRRFVYRLSPETKSSLCERIRTYIDSDIWAGNITTAHIAKTLEIDEELAGECFDVLQKNGGYYNYLTTAGDKAIAKGRNPDKDKKLIRFSRKTDDNRLLRFVFGWLLVPIVSMLILYLQTQLTNIVRNTCLSVFFAYVANCIQGVLGRKLGDQ